MIKSLDTQRQKSPILINIVSIYTPCRQLVNSFGSTDGQTGGRGGAFAVEFSPSIALFSCREQWDIVAQCAEQVPFFGSFYEGCIFSFPFTHQEFINRPVPWNDIMFLDIEL